MTISTWEGCYDDGWQGEIVPEAFAHPAKVSRALIRRIYQHAFVEGWLVPGDVCCDPFGGIAGTALDAMWSGLTWVGVELEPRFVALGQQNIALWKRKYGSKPGFGGARLLQGDSRRLSSVLASADLVCSSPPYAGNEKSDYLLSDDGKTRRRDVKRGYKQGHGCYRGSETYGETEGQLGRLREGTAPSLICSSPPYAEGLGHGGAPTRGAGRSDDRSLDAMQSGYGESAGQLATMREGEAPACIVSSPPYAGSAIEKNSAGVDHEKQYESYRKAGGGASFEKFCATQERHSNHYGTEDGQLGSMPEGCFDAVVGSPPYEGMEAHPSLGHPERDGMPGGDINNRSTTGATRADVRYGATADQLGNQTGDTFWQAAREIVAQCHAILRPGGHAIWITKDFVRKGKRVPFSDQWQALCEQEGFRLVCRHRAMLVARHGEQDTIFGDSQQITTQRKSFFRRLAEKKGSPAIDWEDVLCMVRV